MESWLSHLELPPSLGNYEDESGCSPTHDDLCGELAHIRYQIVTKATLTDESDSTKPFFSMMSRRSLLVFPTPDVEHVTLQRETSYGSVTEASSDFRTGFLKRRSGRLLLEAHAARGYIVLPQSSTIPNSPFIDVHIRLIAHTYGDRIARPLKVRITGSIEARSQCFDRHETSKAPDGTPLATPSHLLVIKHLPLKDTTIEIGSRHDHHDRSGSVPQPPQYDTQSASAEKVIRLCLAKPRVLTPTFQSCFVDRSYRLKLEMIATGQTWGGCKIAVNIPLLVTCHNDYNDLSFEVDHSEVNERAEETIVSMAPNLSTTSPQDQDISPPEYGTRQIGSSSSFSIT